MGRGWVLLLVLVGCTPGPTDKPTRETCDNLVDDDGDDQIDCLDPDCAAGCGEDCTDGDDNDGDGLIDCADDDCDGSCVEACDDDRDNDGDGDTDCDDLDCVGSCPEVCDDLLDNDGDGLTDCEDTDCAGPACPEACADGWDNDGDGLIDCDDDDCDGSCPEICDDGLDNDGDGGTDCEDTDCDGGCPEVCDDGRDNDGDRLTDCDDYNCRPVCDADGDGYVGVDFGGDDCDDTRIEVNPAMQEICNEDGALDDDCNGLIDLEDPGLNPATLVPLFSDDDEDGFGAGASFEYGCSPEPGWSANDLDCDDADPDVNPDMPEICNEDVVKDDDCDGLFDDEDPDVDEDSFLDWYEDRDEDGLGRDTEPVRLCAPLGGYATNNLDCDDGDPFVGEATLWYPDADGDGWGAGEPHSDDATCESPAPGYALGTDCDDDNPRVYPSAEEVCEDGIDQDCDGEDRPCILGLWEEEAFTGVVMTEGCSNWETFRLGLPERGVLEVALWGTYDTEGYVCDDPVVAQGVADALRTLSSYEGSCRGTLWTVCDRHGGVVWLNPPAPCSGMSCPNPGYIIRPCVIDENWGGINTATCTSQPDQTMGLWFR